MHELVPHMAAMMQARWIKSKAGTPEQHAHDLENTEMFNVWFGADMEPKEEGNEAAVESVFEVLAGAHTLRLNPDPNPDPNPNPNPPARASELSPYPLTQ